MATTHHSLMRLHLRRIRSIYPVEQQQQQQHPWRKTATSSVTTSTTTRWLSSSKTKTGSTSTNTTSDTNFRHVYVHPLSQIVLECLQANHPDWLVRRNLHRNALVFHRDGTFCLDNTLDKKKKEKKDNTTITGKEKDIATPPQNMPSTTATTTTLTTRTNLRIWTSFDNSDKKHWLTLQQQQPNIQTKKDGISKNTKQRKFQQFTYTTARSSIPGHNTMVTRYMLQDNLMPNWTQKGSLPDRIQSAVQELIQEVEANVQRSRYR